jgi:hypothetical protein
MYVVIASAMYKEAQVPREDTTAWMQEVGQRRTQLPRMSGTTSEAITLTYQVPAEHHDNSRHLINLVIASEAKQSPTMKSVAWGQAPTTSATETPLRHWNHQCLSRRSSPYWVFRQAFLNATRTGWH